MYATIGVLLVGLGAAGIWLPLIPTVGPLLLASFFFAKSFPALEERLIRIPLFAKFHHYLDSSSVMPMQTRLTSIGLMWVSILVSGSALWFTHQPVWLLWVLVALGLVGTIFIWRFRRAPSS